MSFPKLDGREYGATVSMRRSVRSFWILLNIFLLGVSGEAMAAGEFPARSCRQIQVTVVAERADHGASFTMPTPHDPVCVVACDGGFIREGDARADEQPPPAGPVARALREILESRHYLPATAQESPSLLIVYHQGLINRNVRQIGNLSEIDPNLKARLALVAKPEQAGEIENFLMSRVQGRTNPAFRIPDNLSVQARGILDLTRNSRWFVVMSAYDFASLCGRQPRLVWRVKMSTESAGIAAADALPALLQAGAPYFGCNVDAPRILPMPLLPADSSAVGATVSEESARPGEAAGQLDHIDLGSLIQRERAGFSWSRAASDQGDAIDRPQ